MLRSINLQWINVGSLPLTKTEPSNQTENLCFNFLDTLFCRSARPPARPPTARVSAEARTLDSGRSHNLTPEAPQSSAQVPGLTFFIGCEVLGVSHGVVGSSMCTYSKRKEFRHPSCLCPASYYTLILRTFTY